jgi:hypothetical protein
VEVVPTTRLKSSALVDTRIIISATGFGFQNGANLFAGVNHPRRLFNHPPTVTTPVGQKLSSPRRNLLPQTH